MDHATTKVDRSCFNGEQTMSQKLMDHVIKVDRQCHYSRMVACTKVDEPRHKSGWTVYPVVDGLYTQKWTDRVTKVDGPRHRSGRTASQKWTGHVTKVHGPRHKSGRTASKSGWIISQTKTDHTRRKSSDETISTTRHAQSVDSQETPLLYGHTGAWADRPIDITRVLRDITRVFKVVVPKD